MPLISHRAIVKAALLKDLGFGHRLYLPLFVDFHTQKRIKEEKEDNK
jgi:hypothetical protein